MHKFFFVSFLLIGFAIPCLSYAEPADEFLRAYFLIQEGDAAEKAADNDKATEKYTAAANILREIRKGQPDWNPNIINFRLKYCIEHLLRVGAKVEVEELQENGPTVAAIESSIPANKLPENPPVPVIPSSSSETLQEQPVTPQAVVFNENSERVANLERDLAEAHKEIRKLQDEKIDLEARLHQAEENLKTVNLSDARIDSLLKQNDVLKEKLAEAEAKLQTISSSSTENSAELDALKADLTKTQAELEMVKNENTQLHAANDLLRKDLEDTRSQLKMVTADPASSINAEALQNLQKENVLLRSIVERQYQEDTKRTEARYALAKDLDELGSRSEVLRAQLDILRTPLTPLSDEERQLLRLPESTIRTEADDPSKLSGIVTAKRSDEQESEFRDQNAALTEEAKKLFAKQDMDGAAAKYEEIIQNDPKNILALSNLGVIRFRQDQMDAAQKALKTCLEIDPQDAFALSVLGIVHYRQGKFDDAISSLTRAISINPNNHETHNYLGIAYSQKGYQDAAQKELGKAIELLPNYADAHFNLAVVLASQSPPALDLARKHYKKSLELGMAKDPEIEKLIGK